MIGFGTVVTGTLIDGSLRVGDELMILPSGLRGRIRGLQAHQHKEDIARPGSRTAINISGIDMNQIQRGNVVTHPGDYIATRRLDVRFGLLKDVIKPLTHNMQVKFFIGAAETIGRVRLLGDEALQPGKDGWLQLELVQPVIAVRGDHYILRRPSPGETLGGGVVLDAHPKGRHKRFSNETLTRLETLAHGDPSDVILEVLLYNNAAPIREIVQASRLEEMDAKLAINTLFAGGNLIDLESKDDNLLSIESDALVASRRYWEDLSSQLIFEVESYHRSHPFRLGMSREELKSRLKLSLRPELASRLFIATLHKLTKEGLLVEVGPYVQIKGHVLHFPPQQQQKVDILLNRFASTPYAPPSVKDCIEEVGEEIYNALVELERLLPVSQEVVFRKEDYEEMVRQVLQLISKNMTVTAAQVRDHFDTSRRFALALLEYMDQQGLTVRDGDIRRIKSKGGNPAG
jgi:selenocysteine-specific elongation factor